MLEIDGQTQDILNKVENIFKDRFSHYLFIVVDGDNSYRAWSSDIVARGMIESIRSDIENKWKAEVG